MKPLCLLVAAFTLMGLGCMKKYSGDSGKNSVMLMDSTYAGDRSVTVVQAKDKLRLGESMKNFEDQRNITQTDIDAEKRIESKEVQYLKKGDKLRIAEPGR